MTVEELRTAIARFPGDAVVRGHVRVNGDLAETLVTMIQRGNSIDLRCSRRANVDGVAQTVDVTVTLSVPAPAESPSC